MIGGGATIGYSTTATDSVGAKSLGSFSGVGHRNKHLISGAGTASSVSPSRMHLVDSWRESFMNHSYDKHVSDP